MEISKQHMMWVADEVLDRISALLIEKMGGSAIILPKDGRKRLRILQSKADALALLNDFGYADDLRRDHRRNGEDKHYRKYYIKHFESEAKKRFEDYPDDIQQEADDWVYENHPLDYEGIAAAADEEMIADRAEMEVRLMTTLSPAGESFVGLYNCYEGMEKPFAYYIAENDNPLACGLLTRACGDSSNVFKDNYQKACQGWVAPELSAEPEDYIGFLYNVQKLEDRLAHFGYTADLFFEAFDAGVPIADIVA